MFAVNHKTYNSRNSSVGVITLYIETAAAATMDVLVCLIWYAFHVRLPIALFESSPGPEWR
jgi:hypothetical protein